MAGPAAEATAAGAGPAEAGRVSAAAERVVGWVAGWEAATAKGSCGRVDGPAADSG